MRVARVAIAVVVSLIALSALAGAAVAYEEPKATYETNPTFANCERCHDPYFSVGSCIHGNYTTASTKCQSCHDIHDAPDGGFDLLPGPTIQATCFTCHDGTQGRGVYGAIAARGVSVGAQHRCETTNVVPGGDRATGGDATMAFGGLNGTLSCDDCHSPHASSVVATFTNERTRYAGMLIGPTRFTNNLLKQRPGGATSSTPVYGSDWCGACHKGRLTGSGMPNNHPVESSMTAGVNSFYYQRVSLVATDAATSTTVIGGMGRTNRGYLMPFPRTAQQQDHGPICQQCHEDSRSVGSLNAAGNIADPATFTVTAAGTDGATVTVSPLTFDNPRFQNFPHETVNRRFLVEDADDLCLNCHPPLQLP